MLLENGDFYHASGRSDVVRRSAGAPRTLYADRDAWSKKSILNVACSGKFSSDRTIAEYARDIWDAKPCPVS